LDNKLQNIHLQLGMRSSCNSKNMSREPVAFLDSRPGPKIVRSATRYPVCGGIFVGPDVIHAPQRRSENDPRGRRMLQASTIPSENFCPLRLIRDSEVLHSRARAERREIRRCEDADGRHLPIPHLPSTDLPPLRPLVALRDGTAAFPTAAVASTLMAFSESKEEAKLWC
jgi:hypothetical protein